MYYSLALHSSLHYSQNAVWRGERVRFPLISHWHDSSTVWSLVITVFVPYLALETQTAQMNEKYLAVSQLRCLVFAVVCEVVIILKLGLMTDMSILKGVVWLGLVQVKGRSAFQGLSVKSDIMEQFTPRGGLIRQSYENTLKKGR